MGGAALSTAATLLWTEDTNCTVCLAIQIIQHTGHLPGLEDAESIKAQPSPSVQRQTSDLSALRPKRQDRPQQLQGNVEGILTLQLSHLNVVHTFRAVTIPAQVRHALTSPYVRKEKRRREEKGETEKGGKDKKDYTFWRQFDGKPSITPGCPDHHVALLCMSLAVMTL